MILLPRGRFSPLRVSCLRVWFVGYSAMLKFVAVTVLVLGLALFVASQNVLQNPSTPLFTNELRGHFAPIPRKTREAIVSITSPLFINDDADPVGRAFVHSSFVVDPNNADIGLPDLPYGKGGDTSDGNSNVVYIVSGNSASALSASVFCIVIAVLALAF